MLCVVGVGDEYLESSTGIETGVDLQQIGFGLDIYIAIVFKIDIMGGY